MATKAEDADTILRTVIDKYESCTTYRDSGRTVGYITIDFKTVFRRPQFRFDWTMQSPNDNATQMIWGNQTKAWLTYPDEVKEVDDIGRAIAGAAGVSVGTAPAISMMLMPEIRAGRHLLSHQYQYAGETYSNNFDCYVIRADYQEDCFIELFISKNDHCIRKIIREFVSSREGEERSIAFLKERDPSLAQKMVEHYATAPRTPTRGVIEYVDVAFEIDIADEQLAPSL